ncbi:TPA: hypothetical protein DCQ44_01850 [Candidatus Taylorbacteria bacterium]|nr:hypothetical protein [Candidatus Taylorbacteria bacterium]
MKTILRIVTNPENIISYALGFVVMWFGLHEIFSPQDWVVFAPPFLGDGTFTISLVVIHGIVLVSCALLLFLNIHRRIAAIILTLVFIEIIITLVTQSGLSDIAVRDIGLCGMALGLAFTSTSELNKKRNSL